MRIEKPILGAMLMIVALLLPALPLAAASENEGESSLSVVQAVPPKYPPIARAAHISGEVVVEATIDAQGAVSAVNIVRGHKLLIEGAENAARRWTFNPLERGAKDRKVSLTFQFTLILSNKGTPADLGVIFWPPYKVEVRDAPQRVD